MPTFPYRQQHDVLRSLAREIPLEAARVPQVPVKALLIELRDKLLSHLRLEDDVIYPAMLEHWDVHVREKAAVFQDEMGSLSRIFATFADKWIGEKALDRSPEAFVREWKAVLGAVLNRMDREDNDLFDAVDHPRKKLVRRNRHSHTWSRLHS